MGVTVAEISDFAGIRRIWEEQFTTDAEYLQVMFNQIIPLCTNYIYKEGEEVLSVSSFMPMKFYDSTKNMELNGWYMFGVATLKKAQGEKMASKTILEAIRQFGSKNYHFIFERPANQGLNKFYLKLGFSKSLKKVPYRFVSPEEDGSSWNTGCNSEAKACSKRVLNEIQLRFPKRFEWADTQLLEGLIALGEVEYNNNNISNSTEENTYIAINALNNIDPDSFSGTFFCFPME